MTFTIIWDFFTPLSLSAKSILFVRNFGVLPDPLPLLLGCHIWKPPDGSGRDFRPPHSASTSIGGGGSVWQPTFTFGLLYALIDGGRAGATDQMHIMAPVGGFILL